MFSKSPQQKNDGKKATTREKERPGSRSSSAAFNRATMFLQSEKPTITGAAGTASSSTTITRAAQMSATAAGPNRERSPRAPVLTRRLDGTSMVSGFASSLADSSSFGGPSSRMLPPPSSPSGGGGGKPSLMFELPSSPYLGPSSSPTPSPHWRSSSGSGRAIPKSALLISKCQAFLKQGNMDFPSQSVNNPSADADAHSTTSKTTAAVFSADNRPSLLSNRAESTVSAAFVPPISQPAQVAPNGGTSAIAPAVGNCVFNFDDIFAEWDMQQEEGASNLSSTQNEEGTGKENTKTKEEERSLKRVAELPEAPLLLIRLPMNYAEDDGLAEEIASISLLDEDAICQSNIPLDNNDSGSIETENELGASELREEEHGQKQGGEEQGIPPLAKKEQEEELALAEVNCPLDLAAAESRLETDWSWPLASSEQCSLYIEETPKNQRDQETERVESKEGNPPNEPKGNEKEVAKPLLPPKQPEQSPKRPAAHQRKGRRRGGPAKKPPPLPPFNNRIGADEQPSTSCSTPLLTASPSQSCSSAAITPLSLLGARGNNSRRTVERLRLAGIQLRGIQCGEGTNGGGGGGNCQLAVGLRLDGGEELFRTGPVQLLTGGGNGGGGDNPLEKGGKKFGGSRLSMLSCSPGGYATIGEEFALDELPADFQSVQLSMYELLEGARVQRPIGRLRLSRRDLLDRTDSNQDCWLPIQRVPRGEANSSELLGALCAELDWDSEAKLLSLRVLDFTVWTLLGRRENPLERCEGGRLFLKLCVAFGRSAFTAMQRIRLSERRGVEQARFDCAPFFLGPSASSTAAALADNSSTAGGDCSAGEWPSGLSACSSPACSTPSWAPKSQPRRANPRQQSHQQQQQRFRFPPSPMPGTAAGGTPRSTPGGSSKAAAGQPASWEQQPRVYIKLYGQPNGTEDSFCGSVRIPLDRDSMRPKELPRGPNWFNIRSRMSAKFNIRTESVGDIRLKLWYSRDEVLPLVHYQPLYLNLIRSLNVTPYSHSLISLIQRLPIDTEHLAKPLMKIFIHSNQIRLFVRLICSEHVSNCSDVNTLFRSQSLASRVMNEMMKFIGHKYLVVTLKPLIDLIFAERKSCEIDPSKLKQGESLEQNLRNVTVYAELAFSRVVDSRHRCPQALGELFSELRSVMEQFFPDREDVARLAISSFLIMRFFAFAILNPKLSSLKIETPDVDVSRTLVLVSKILQRLANCVVSAHPLTTKEQWLTPVLHRFSDETHKTAMINFLDGISAPIDNENNNSDQGEELLNNENLLPPSPHPFRESNVLKSGYLVERRFGPVKKRSFKNFIHPKRRLVVLTDTMLNWQKTSSKESPPSTSFINNLNNEYTRGGTTTTTDQQKNQVALSDVTSVIVLPDAKNTFRVATVNSEVHFQANNEAEMNEWVILLQKQQRRHLMLLNRPDGSSSRSTAQVATEVDIEKELQLVNGLMVPHFDTLCEWGWCCRTQCPRCEQRLDPGEALPPSPLAPSLRPAAVADSPTSNI